jgi:ribosomal protein L11 methylase PrmA
MALLVSFDALLSSDGVLILSGILSIESDAVIGALRMNGYALKREATEGEWWLGVAARDQRVS